MKLKKALLLFVLTVTLILTCALPALAGTEYGMVYDGTSRMQANMLQHMGEVVLPELSDRQDLEFRVDIVSTLQGYTLPDYAEGLYNTYDYGKDYGNGGLLYLLYLTPDESGFGLGGYEVYYGGVAYPDLADSVKSAMDGRINETAWNSGEPLDRAAVNDALQVYADAIEDYFAEIGPVEGYVPGAAEESAATAETTTEPAATTGTEQQLEYVTDSAGLLSDDQYAALNEQARRISEKYNCGVYVVTVDDYQKYTSGDVYDCATELFNKYDLGYGDTKNGVLLLLSMADRDYTLIAHGDTGNAAFTDYGKERMADSFLRYFGRNDWNGGFDDYLSSCSQLLEMEANGQPYDIYDDDGGEGPSKAARTGVVLGVPTVVSGLVNRMQSRKMKSVRSRTNASTYASPAGLILHGQQDRYTHSTESRTRIVSTNTNRGSSGGGHGTTIGGGGFSGHSGKF